MRALVLAAIISLSACSAVPTVARLPIPPPLDLPKIEAKELECLTDSAFGRLRDRDQLLNSRVTTLENIIRSTH